MKENIKNKCSISNDTLEFIIDNVKERLIKHDEVFISSVACLLEKALEGVESKKDLCDSEIEDIKKIRNMIKGL